MVLLWRRRRGTACPVLLSPSCLQWICERGIGRDGIYSMEVTLKNTCFLNNKDILGCRPEYTGNMEAKLFIQFFIVFIAQIFAEHMQCIGQCASPWRWREHGLIYNSRICKTYRNVNSYLQDSCSCSIIEKKQMTMSWPRGRDSWLGKAKEDFKREGVLPYLTTDRNALWWIERHLWACSILNTSFFSSFLI